MSERVFNPHLAKRLDVPERVTWLSPIEVISALGIRTGETIADIGAGTGYFSMPLAKAAGDEGKVYAVDSQEKMLQILRAKLSNSTFTNIELMHAEADSISLPGSLCGLLFFANVWHEFADRSAVLREAKRLLRNHGQIAILDWRPDVEPEHGPPLAHRLSEHSVAHELLAAGFKHLSQQNIGKYSWLIQAVLS